MQKKIVTEKPLLIDKNNLTKEEIKSLLIKMLTIRLTEERIALRVSEKKVRTPCHLYIGEEASAVGVCANLRKTDFVFSNHRSHGHFLAKGGNIKELFAEIYCKETGCSGGRGGSMHLCDPSIGLLGSSSIVAGCLGIGLGPALKSKIMREDTVSVIFHGDCVPEEGIWSESLNFAAIKNLPVVYICENNLYAASAPLEERRVKDNIEEVAKAIGLNVEVVDGNDIFAVYDVAKRAVARARNGEGPQFIETRTYRWLGHVGNRDDIDVGLRSLEELNYWKRRCPIRSLEDKLFKDGLFTQKELDELHSQISALVDEAEQFAIDSNKPNPETLLDNVYEAR